MLEAEFTHLARTNRRDGFRTFGILEVHLNRILESLINSPPNQGAVPLLCDTPTSG